MGLTIKPYLKSLDSMKNMQIRKLSITVFSSLAAVLITSSIMPTLAMASEIRLHDCDGNLRASTELEDGQTKGIKFSLATEESNSKAMLSKTDSASILERSAKDTSLIFASVEGGDWKVCKENGKALAFNSVEFIEPGSESLKVASLVAGSAALLSGVAIASGSSDDNSKSNGANIIEPSQPDRVVNEQPSSASTNISNRPNGIAIIPSRCAKPSTAAATVNDNCDDAKAPISVSPYD